MKGPSPPNIQGLQSRVQLSPHKALRSGYESIDVPMRKLLDPEKCTLQFTPSLVFKPHRRPGFAWHAWSHAPHAEICNSSETLSRRHVAKMLMQRLL